MRFRRRYFIRLQIDDVRVADQIVNAAMIFAKNKERVDDTVKGNLSEQCHAYDIAQQKAVHERRRLQSVNVDDLHVQKVLAIDWLETASK